MTDPNDLLDQYSLLAKNGGATNLEDQLASALRAALATQPQLVQVGYVWKTSQGIQWGGPEGTGHHSEQPVYVLGDGEAGGDTHQPLSDLRRAVLDKGPRPDVHEEIMARHRREWPFLWRAIDRLVAGSATLMVDINTRCPRCGEWVRDFPDPAPVGRPERGPQ